MKNNWFDKDKIEYIKYIMPFFFCTVNKIFNKKRAPDILSLI